MNLEMQIEKLTLGPNDVLVVKLKSDIYSDQYAELITRLKTLLVPGTRFMVITADVDLAVVQLADIPPERIPEQLMGKYGQA